MEDTLREPKEILYIPLYAKCLNPCSNGRYSQSIFVSLFSIIAQVLILVLMEDTLRDIKKQRYEKN